MDVMEIVSIHSVGLQSNNEPIESPTNQTLSALHEQLQSLLMTVVALTERHSRPKFSKIHSLTNCVTPTRHTLRLYAMLIPLAFWERRTQVCRTLLSNTFHFDNGNTNQAGNDTIHRWRSGGTQYLVDIGATVSVLPPKARGHRRGQQRSAMYTTSDSSIKTFGSCLMYVDVDLCRSMVCPSWEPKSQPPFFGTDFLEAFGLLVDSKNCWLFHFVTNLSSFGTVTCTPAVGALRTIRPGTKYSIAIFWRTTQRCIGNP